MTSAHEQTARALTPSDVRFWRHAVLFSVLLLARPMQGAGFEYAAGVWVGSMAITCLAGLVIGGLAVVFFTSSTKGRFWTIFVAVAWAAVCLQVGAAWYTREASAPDPSSSRYFDPDK